VVDVYGWRMKKGGHAHLEIRVGSTTFRSTMLGGHKQEWVKEDRSHASSQSEAGRT
jgi:hypothetical protein